MAEQAVAQTQLVPVAPKGLKPEENEILRQRSSELVQRLHTEDNLELVDSVSNIGAQAQKDGAMKMQLYQTRVGDLLTDLSDDEGGQIPKGLLDLRLKLDQINPHSQDGKLARIPFIGFIFKTKPMKALKRIAVKYQTVGTQVNAVIGGLRAGQDQLLKDNLSLKQLRGDVEEQQLVVRKNIYLGELILAELQKRRAETVDPAVQDKLDIVMNAVALRVADLRMMEQANLQFFVSIDMTVDNNRQLHQTVERTLTVTTGLITIGLAIQAALAKQRQVLEATRATQDYAANLLVANAAAVRKQTAEIGDIYQKPILALDKVRAAYNDLMAAIDESEKAKKAGVQTLQATILEVGEMSGRLEAKIGDLRSVEEVKPKSIEA